MLPFIPQLKRSNIYIYTGIGQKDIWWKVFLEKRSEHDKSLYQTMACHSQLLRQSTCPNSFASRYVLQDAAKKALLGWRITKETPACLPSPKWPPDTWPWLSTNRLAMNFHKWSRCNDVVAKSICHDSPWMRSLQWGHCYWCSGKCAARTTSTAR